MDAIADLSWAGCAVTQGPPKTDENRGAASPEASHRSKGGIGGAVADREPAAVGGLLVPSADALASAFVARVGNPSLEAAPVGGPGDVQPFGEIRSCR